VKRVIRDVCEIGIAPGKAFDPSTLDPAIANAIKEGIASAEEKL